MLGGVKLHTETLATEFYDHNINFKGGDFLKQKITMKLFREEQHLPSNVIDRDSMRDWKKGGSLDTFQRAKVMVNTLIAAYTRPAIDSDKESRLHAFMLDLARKAGMDQLPLIEDFQPA